MEHGEIDVITTHKKGNDDKYNNKENLIFTNYNSNEKGDDDATNLKEYTDHFLILLDDQNKVEEVKMVNIATPCHSNNVEEDNNEHEDR